MPLSAAETVTTLRFVFIARFVSDTRRGGLWYAFMVGSANSAPGRASRGCIVNGDAPIIGRLDVT